MKGFSRYGRRKAVRYMGKSPSLYVKLKLKVGSTACSMTMASDPHADILRPVIVPFARRGARMVCMQPRPQRPPAMRPLAGSRCIRTPTATWLLPALLVSHVAELQGRPAPPLLALQGNMSSARAARAGCWALVFAVN